MTVCAVGAVCLEAAREREAVEAVHHAVARTRAEAEERLGAPFRAALCNSYTFVAVAMVATAIVLVVASWLTSFHRDTWAQANGWAPRRPGGAAASYSHEAAASGRRQGGEREGRMRSQALRGMCRAFAGHHGLARS